jgi:hypothetical protein
MNARWTYVVKSLLAICILCVIGLLVFGFLSSRGNVWERLTIASMTGLLASIAAMYGLVVIYYVILRPALRRHIKDRRPLTDQEFLNLAEPEGR